MSMCWPAADTAGEEAPVSRSTLVRRLSQAPIWCDTKGFSIP